MAFKTSNGIVLRNPAEKAKRFVRQMKSGCVRETGEQLDYAGLSYRAGNLQARQDRANAYNSNLRKKRLANASLKNKRS